MFEYLVNERCRGVLLDCSTQIEIMQLVEDGKTYNEIDLILEVPKGSSEYTIKQIQED